MTAVYRRERSTVPRDRRGRFVNWARNESSAPTQWHHPTDEAQVVEIVKRCAENGRRLRVVGTGHSFSRIAAPDDHAMSLATLRSEVTIDRARNAVTVPGGMTIREITTSLARHGLALPIVGSIQAQTVAGAIATGTHGSSLTYGNLATLVTSMQIVTGTGEIRTIGGDELDAVRVHLGALGVVTAVTLTTTNARRLHQTIEQVPLAEVSDQLIDIARSAEWVKVWWLPHAPTVQVVRYAVTGAPVTRRPSAKTQRWIDERVMHRFVFPALVAYQHRRPQTAASTNRRMHTRYLGAPSQVGADMLMLNTPMPIRHRETEAALPMTDAPDALKRILDIFRDDRPAANFPLEIRFVRGDTNWMSPAYGADTCQIGAYMTDGPDCTRYFDAFWAATRPLGARPHWGKEFDHDASELRALYPAYEKFVALRDEYDPVGVFASRLLR